MPERVKIGDILGKWRRFDFREPIRGLGIAALFDQGRNDHTVIGVLRLAAALQETPQIFETVRPRERLD